MSIDHEKTFQNLQKLYLDWMEKTTDSSDDQMEELLYDISLVLEGNYPDDMKEITNKLDILGMSGRGSRPTSVYFENGLDVNLSQQAAEVLSDWFLNDKEWRDNPVQKIYKHALQVRDEPHRVKLPKYSDIVHVDKHPDVGNVVNFWYKFDEEDENDFEMRTFLTVGTGHDFASSFYHGTVLDGNYVWHLLEVKG